MTDSFQNHFSDASNDYRLYRPRYPSELFAYLASISPERKQAWDCATGSGQAALELGGYFSEVIATDASSTQIESARCDDETAICFRVASAEQSGIEANSVDLITVAQALHWFDIQAFSKEVNRVLKPGGVLAVWTYNLLQIQPEIDAQVNHLYASILNDFWPPERVMVENGYAEIDFPFAEVTPPDFQMVANWGIPQLLGYLRTWSALKRYRKQHGVDPAEFILPELLKIWGNADAMRAVRWPLSLRVWKK